MDEVAVGADPGVVDRAAGGQQRPGDRGRVLGLPKRSARLLGEARPVADADRRPVGGAQLPAGGEQLVKWRFARASRRELLRRERGN